MVSLTYCLFPVISGQLWLRNCFPGLNRLVSGGYRLLAISTADSNLRNRIRANNLNVGQSCRSLSHIYAWYPCRTRELECTDIQSYVYTIVGHYFSIEWIRDVTSFLVTAIVHFLTTVCKDNFHNNLFHEIRFISFLEYEII